jgi:hypothetical protein
VATADPGYTVFMTKGAYVVTSAVADAILEAVRTGKADVTISLEVMGAVGRKVEMTLITSHVVSSMKHQDDRGEVEFANVRQLRR